MLALGDQMTPPATLTPEQIERIELLAADGMPKPWIAEDVGATRYQLTYLKLDPDHVKAWQSVWSGIRHKRHLLELHNQFAPKHS